ncbi:hypothetical protein B0H17DRAFT_1212905 [Mycena rosella]|uniref:Uncharacterized protein n=1 Tax=Mycena rosella TaxID=1033263 RepID=A0AAD7CS38_MYCRO|nr:hypothetical protein B0H17DRAFT_1212905 [Mycena rosella]
MALCTKSRDESAPSQSGSNSQLGVRIGVYNCGPSPGLGLAGSISDITSTVTGLVAAVTALSGQTSGIVGTVLPASLELVAKILKATKEFVERLGAHRQGRRSGRTRGRIPSPTRIQGPTLNRGPTRSRAPSRRGGKKDKAAAQKAVEPGHGGNGTKDGAEA